MTRVVRRWLVRWLLRTESVRVADCVHYCAFRYGRAEFNPYENYVVALASGAGKAEAQQSFVEFLRYYRPRNFGEALGVQSAGTHPLWSFPWESPASTLDASGDGWLADPAKVPDILTHFSERGILRSRIEQEFSWLETAYASIRDHGYQPKRYAGPLLTRKLIAANGQTRYLVMDGNHRLSALVALGHDSMDVRYARRATVKEDSIGRWPQVKSGAYSVEDARQVFRAYFEGNRRPRTSEVPAAILEGVPVSAP